MLNNIKYLFISIKITIFAVLKLKNNKNMIQEEELTCYEVLTLYKSGKKRKNIITANNEEKMWEIYDKTHNKDLIASAEIIDVWPQ